MRLDIHGAAGTVTGSCYHLHDARRHVLFECGMFQGGAALERQNRRAFPFAVPYLQAVVISHAHLDHCGRLPLLVRRGYRGPVYCTPATAELMRVILDDAAHLQEEDTRRENRRRARAGRRELAPLFEQVDVRDALALVQTVPYERSFTVVPGLDAVFHDAGHILGAAITEFMIDRGATRRRLVMSGDIGPSGQPIQRDPHPLNEADFVVLESTYGDRDHRSLEETVAQLRDIVVAVQRAGEKLIVPSFAVGRAQTLLFELRSFAEQGLLGGMPVFVDSPMAIDATDIYRRHREDFDHEGQALMRAGKSLFDFPGVRFLRRAEDSRALNDLAGPAIIIAGSGMCNGGRVLHHFRHHLWRPGAHVLIVGYQGQGTLGRRLVDGDKLVKVLGEPVAVRAHIHTLGGFSAHAGQRDLLQWAGGFAAAKPRLLLTHGEEHSRSALAAKLRERFGYAVTLPRAGEGVEVA